MTTSNERLLLTSQRNRLFELIQDAGLASEDFILYENVAEKTAKVTHKQTEYFFGIRVGGTNPFLVIFSPGGELLDEKRECIRWLDVVRWFREWLSNILREIETPDLWEGLAGENRLIQDTTEQQQSDNLPFTQAELPQVERALEEIKAYIVKIGDLSDAQKKIIDARFDYLEKAETRMGRKDWVNIVISNLLGIAIALTLNGDSTRDLFRFAGQIVRQLLGGALYLSGPH